MEKGLDCLADIVPGRETWRIKVRVLRMWEVPSFLKPDETNSLEMVLIDQKGAKIHATVRKQLLLSIVVDDGNGTAQFQLYDYVLDGIPSLHFKTMGLKYVMSEGGMAEMKDKYFLSIVKKIPQSEGLGRERFEVVRVTNNEETIRSYHAIGNNYTPLKCIFKPPFIQVAPSGGDGGSVSTALSLAGSYVVVNRSDEASTSRGRLSGVHGNDDMPMDLGDPALALSLGSLFQESVNKAK